MQTAMVLYFPTYGRSLASLILSQGSTITIQKIHLLSCIPLLLTQKTIKRTTALSSLIIPTCQNHHPKFTNYLINICHSGICLVSLTKSKTSAHWLHIKQKKIKLKESTNQSTRSFGIPICNYFGTRVLCQ